MTSMLNLSDRVAIVTGAARGIGKAIAKLLSARGAVVLMNDFCSEEILAASAVEISESTGGECLHFVFDAGNSTAVKEFYSVVFKRFKRVDILVNNAGILRDNLIPMISNEDIEKTYNANVFSVIYNTQYASRLMARSGGGSIVNVSSIIGRVGNSGQTVYGGSKAAVLGITLSSAKELAPQGIRVNAVAPGFIDTEMTRNLPASAFQERLSSVKSGRIGTAEDVARTVLFLASDMSDYVTGQIIGVDGGMLV